MTKTPIGECRFKFQAGPLVLEPVLDCKMRCSGCDVTIEFPVISRHKDEDILKWMEKVQAAAGQVHAYVNPNCKAGTCDLQIPMPEGTSNIGEIVKL